MRKFILLFLIFYSAIFWHLNKRTSQHSPQEPSSDQYRSARDRIREELHQELDKDGELSQAFEKIQTRRQAQRQRSHESSYTSFHEGPYAFLADEFDSQDTFLRKLALFASDEENQSYSGQMNILEYAKSFNAQNNPHLIRIALNVFEGIYDQHLQASPAQEEELIRIAVEILEKQIVDPLEKERLRNEIQALGFSL